MKMLNLYVCDNFMPEYQEVVRIEGFDDVLLKPFPCTCINRSKLPDLKEIFSDVDSSNHDVLIICGDHCNILKVAAQQDLHYRIHTSNYCYKNLVNEKLIEYILEKGGYIISLGWLNHWQENLEAAGFDQETVRRFYHDFCRELVYFDAEIDCESMGKMEDLSAYLELPYRVIPFGLDHERALLKSIVYEWRLDNKNIEYKHTLAELRKESAEYSAIVNIMEKIALSSSKRAIIDKLQELFTVVFGAQAFKYLDIGDSASVLHPDIANLLKESEKDYMLSEDQQEIRIKIGYQSEIYGVLTAGDFLFPQYIEKYTNFAISICRIGALALSNAQKYETLLRSKDEITYMSYHDALTGLFNRSYFKQSLEENADSESLAVFVCDIDKLKYVNDTFGHIEGDKLISMAANALKNCFRKSDIVARIGGDEFAVIVPECSHQMAEMLKNRLNTSVQKENESPDARPYQLSLSAGYAIKETQNANIEAVFHQADVNMYDEKMRKKQFIESCQLNS